MGHFANVLVTEVDAADLVGQAATPPPAEIQVWEFRSEVTNGLSALEALLSDDERQRAARFHFTRDAHRFTVTRARTRSILAAYLQSDPRELQFTYSKHGKPSVASATPQELRFNVSHSGDQALVAVARGREVGTDVELIRNNIECEQLAERFFSMSERELIRILPAEQKLVTFFRLWTCKEAFLKAHGAGLSRSLSSFDVQLGTAPGQLLSIRGNAEEDAEEQNRWRLIELEAQPGYASAAVVEGALENLHIFRLQSK